MLCSCCWWISFSAAKRFSWKGVWTPRNATILSLGGSVVLVQRFSKFYAVAPMFKTWTKPMLISIEKTSSWYTANLFFCMKPNNHRSTINICLWTSLTNWLTKIQFRYRGSNGTATEAQDFIQMLCEACDRACDRATETLSLFSNFDLLVYLSL